MRRSLLVAIGAALFTVGLASPAGALGGNPDMLPSGSLACTDRVQSSQGVTINGYADYNAARFTTLMSSTLGGPETVVFSATTRGDLQIREPGKEYPTYNVPVAPPTAGTFLFRNCVEATGGPVYRYKIVIGSTDRTGLADVGPHQARLGPGGKLCGDYVEGPSVGRISGVSRLVASADTAVRFDITATIDWGFAGAVQSFTGTSVDQTYAPADDISSLSACAVNTSTRMANVSFELSAV